jgi:hypothetical protein
MFFFDGIVQEGKLKTWLKREKVCINNIVQLFRNLGSNTEVRRKLPALVAATGHFVAKNVCGCDVRICVSECDVEMTHFAQKESSFAILSEDTDFVILQGARHFLSVTDLNLTTMTTLTYSREGLLEFLGLQPQQLFLFASLLGNDIIPLRELQNFHRRFPQAQNISDLVHSIAGYIKKMGFDTYGDEELRSIAKDVFQDENKADDLSTSIKTYLPLSTDVEEKNAVDDIHVSEMKLLFALKWHTYWTLTIITSW